MCPMVRPEEPPKSVKVEPSSSMYHASPVESN